MPPEQIDQPQEKPRPAKNGKAVAALVLGIVSTVIATTIAALGEVFGVILFVYWLALGFTIDSLMGDVHESLLLIAILLSYAAVMSMPVIGMILGIRARKEPGTQKRGLAAAGLFCSAFGLIGTITALSVATYGVIDFLSSCASCLS